jgi:hypothetical protein
LVFIKIFYIKEIADNLNTLTGMIVHTADFFGAVKKPEISYKWSLLVN